MQRPARAASVSRANRERGQPPTSGRIHHSGNTRLNAMIPQRRYASSLPRAADPPTSEYRLNVDHQRIASTAPQSTSKKCRGCDFQDDSADRRGLLQ